MNTKYFWFVIAVIVGACGSSGPPAPNYMNFSTEDDGTFSGKAGTDWSDEELRNNAFGVFCMGGTLENIQIQRDELGNALFNGSCA